MVSSDKNRNLVAAISYIPFLAVVISPVVFLVEKEDKFIRFHALQSFTISVAYYLASLILGNVFLVGSLIGGLITLAALVIWIVSMVKSFRGKMFKWPIFGNWAERQVG